MSDAEVAFAVKMTGLTILFGLIGVMGVLLIVFGGIVPKVLVITYGGIFVLTIRELDSPSTTGAERTPEAVADGGRRD